MAVRDVTELTVYRKAYALAMQIFQASKRFPPEERYALTSQIGRMLGAMITAPDKYC
jgi:hypothetical protein